MASFSVNTTQNIAIDFEVASVGDRIVAFIIDYLIIVAYVIICSFLIFSIGKLGEAGTYLGIVFILLPISFYSLLSEIFLNGQTLGKKIMYIKVIHAGGKQAGFSQYLLRWLMRFVDVWIFSGVVGLLAMAFSDKRQRLGDLVAATIVVKLKSKVNLNDTLYVPTLQNYTPAYPEAVYLSDADIQLCKQVLENYQKTGNFQLAEAAAQKLSTVLQVTPKHDTLTFLYAIITDYNYLSNQQTS